MKYEPLKFSTAVTVAEMKARLKGLDKDAILVPGGNRLVREPRYVRELSGEKERGEGWIPINREANCCDNHPEGAELQIRGAYTAHTYELLVSASHPCGIFSIEMYLCIHQELEDDFVSIPVRDAAGQIVGDLWENSNWEFADPQPPAALSSFSLDHFTTEFENRFVVEVVNLCGVMIRVATEPQNYLEV